MKYALDAVWYMFPGLFASGFASQSLLLTWTVIKPHEKSREPRLRRAPGPGFYMLYPPYSI